MADVCNDLAVFQEFREALGTRATIMSSVPWPNSAMVCVPAISGLREVISIVNWKTICYHLLPGKNSARGERLR